MLNKYSPYFLGDECSANYFSGDTLKLIWYLLMHLVLAAVILSKILDLRITYWSIKAVLHSIFPIYIQRNRPSGT